MPNIRFPCPIVPVNANVMTALQDTNNDSDDGMTLHDALRQATHDSHMRLHTHPLLSPLQNDTITIRDYIYILRSFEAFYTKWNYSCPIGYSAFAGEISPLALLQKDLEQFKGHDIQAFDISTKCKNSEYDEYIGYLYLKQGSTLGGQVIAKHLEKHLGLEKNGQIFFFNAYGDQTGSRWKEFKKYLRDIEGTIDYCRATTTANSVFEDMESEFTHRYKQKVA